MNQQIPQPPHGQQPHGSSPQGQPAYSAYPPQPNQAPQPPKKKPITRRWWFWVLAAIVGLAVMSSLGGGGGAQSSTGTPPGQGAPQKKKEEAMAGMNAPVKSDDMEFTVTDFACGVTVKDSLQTLTPQGKFCRMELTAKNIGTKQVTLMDSNLKIADAAGSEYQSSSETWMVEGTMFLKAINPGNSIKGVVIIDVPTDVTPVTARLAGGMFAQPAKVKLG